MSRTDVYAFKSTIITISANSVAQVGPFPGVNSYQMKLITGGTLGIGGVPGSTLSGVIAGISGALSYTAAQGFPSSYPMSANEIQSVDFGGTVYLYATGATCQVAILFGQSQGNV